MTKELTNTQNEDKMAISQYFTLKGVQNSIVNVLQDKHRAETFTTELLANIQANPRLAECTRETLLKAHMQVASLGLPVSNGLGMAYVIPYANYKAELKRKVLEAQFQLGYKGLIQLALRSEKILKLTAIEVKEGELVDINPITEEYSFNPANIFKRGQLETVAYLARIELVGGFSKIEFMTKEEVVTHAKRFSKSWSKDNSPWHEHFDAMAKKTLLLKVLKYAPLTTELREAFAAERQADYTDEKQVREVPNEAQEEAPQAQPVQQAAAPEPAPAPKKRATQAAKKEPKKKYIEDPIPEADAEAAAMQARYDAAAPEPALQTEDEGPVPFRDF